MKRSRSGAVAIAVRKGEEGAQAAEKLRVVVEAILGTDAGVRIHLNILRLHLLGISGDDGPPDIEEGFTRESIPPSQIRIK